MQANTIDIMASDQLSGAWNAIPYGYGDYSVPVTDWMTSPATNLESARPNSESTVQQNNFFQSMAGRDRLQRVTPQTSSPNPASDADPTENSYLHAVPYHYQHHHHLHQQTASHGSNQNVQQNHPQKQSQPMRKDSPDGARLVPYGYYTQPGRTLAPVAPGSPMPQPSLYPSPPGPVLTTAEESNYNSKQFGGMVYMNGNHVPASIGYTGYTDPSLTGLCSGPGGNEPYHQPYSVSSMGHYGESSPTFPGMGLATVESSFPALKYDAWNLEPSVIQPLMSPMEQPIAIKQEYISSAYHSPSPSTMASGSCVKMELLSDTSRSPPPGNTHLSEGMLPLHGSHPSSSSVLLATPSEKAPNIKPNVASVKKSTRKTNNYGDQFACVECARTFARQCGLTQHTKWHHSGEKPFRCLTCGKCFSEQIALDDHLERHTSTDKPYQCQLCPKAFFHKNDLRRHGFQHTGKAPHACRYCSKTFARKDHRQSHEGSHERKMQRKERKAKNTSRMAVAGGEQQPQISSNPSNGTRLTI
ncbi:PR domain zinc finger protein 1-like [Anopheles stephensi]|uniref:PR domain zinc finger protein 1-like n=1 Tax=Anopheles stephensi TaxID=30069 RepID=UPI001658C065|nr:PR domain zinc finger protein 1-like [Anopheles stephensi]